MQRKGRIYVPAPLGEGPATATLPLTALFSNPDSLIDRKLQSPLSSEEKPTKCIQSRFLPSLQKPLGQDGGG